LRRVPPSPETQKAPTEPAEWRIIVAIWSRQDSGLRGRRLSRIDQLKAQIEGLRSDEIAEIFRWLLERDWESWDRELEEDARTGKLDFLAKQAHKARAKRKLKDL
jgi:hypothetical protein